MNQRMKLLSEYDNMQDNSFCPHNRNYRCGLGCSGVSGMLALVSSHGTVVELRTEAN